MNAYSSLCGMVGLSMGQLGNFEEGIIFFEKGIDNGVRVGDLHALATLEAWYSTLWRLKGDGKRVIDHAQKSNDLPRSRAARYQKEFLLIPMQSIDEFF